MNIENVEFLTTINKNDTINFGAKILHLSLNKDYQDLFSNNELLTNVATLATLALEKPLTARSRNIKDIILQLDFSTDDFKRFYFNLIVDLNGFDELLELSKLYPSNIEASVIVPYVESLDVESDIKNAFKILEGPCWWYSNYQNSLPKGLLRLKELHSSSASLDETSGTTFEQGSTIVVKEFSVGEINNETDSPVESKVINSANAELITITERTKFLPEHNFAVTNEFIPEAGPFLQGIEDYIESEQATYTQTDLSIKVSKSINSGWAKNETFTYQGFTATESFVSLSEPKQTTYPFADVIKEIDVIDTANSNSVLKAQYILQNVSLETKDSHLAIWAYAPETELEGKDLKYALASALFVLHQKAKDLNIPLVVDGAYNIIIKNNPRNVSFANVHFKNTNEVIFPGFKGEFVYLTK